MSKNRGIKVRRINYRLSANSAIDRIDRIIRQSYPKYLFNGKQKRR